MTLSSRRAATACLLAVCAYLVMAATMREGHDWGEDFSLYILHARKFVEDDRRYLMPAVQRHAPELTQVYANGTYSVYALTPSRSP